MKKIIKSLNKKIITSLANRMFIALHHLHNFFFAGTFSLLAANPCNINNKTNKTAIMT